MLRNMAIQARSAARELALLEENQKNQEEYSQMDEEISNGHACIDD